MRKYFLLLSLLSGFFLLASTPEVSAAPISDILDSVKGGSGAKVRAAASIVRQNNGLKFHDNTTAENPNWIDVTDQFNETGKIKKAPLGPSPNDSPAK